MISRTPEPHDLLAYNIKQPIKISIQNLRMDEPSFFP